MADLKAGTTVGGAMVWTQGNFPLFPSGNTLLYRDYTVYTTNDKPQAADNDFVSKAQGGTFEKTITMKGSISSATMMQLQGTAVGTQYALTDSAGALTGSNYQIYAQGDQFKFRAPNTVAAGLIDVLVWTNSTKRYDLSGNLYVSGSIYNLYDSTGGIFYSPKNKPTATDIGLGNVTNDAQLKIASNLSDVANVTTARTNISAAKSGANSDITSLTALSGPLRLGGDGSNAYDAVTLRQLQASSGGGSGATMNGVMNNFLGAVEWFNGSRAVLPSGHLPADGQLLNRADHPELWSAISTGVFISVDDTTWLNASGAKYVHRGKFSTGNGTTTFRMPDLNGQTSDSIIPFLRGDGGGASVGVVYESGAPNIVGTIGFHGQQAGGSGATVLANTSGSFVGNSPQNNWSNASSLSSSGAQSIGNIYFDASQSSQVYGRANEVRPQSVIGIWLIRVNGKFSAANTNFNVINGDTTLPSSGTIVYGGDIRSDYQINGVDRNVGSIRVKEIIGSEVSLELGVVGGSLARVVNDGSVISTNFKGTDQNNFRIMTNTSSVFQRHDGGSWYFMVSDTPTGTYNDLRPVAINLTTGRVSLGNGANMGDSIAMNGNPITGSGQMNFSSSANGRQTLLNTGVTGNSGRIVIPISTTQAWCMQTGTSVLSFNSSGETTLSFPIGFASVNTFVCSNGDANVPGDGYVNSLDSWNLTTTGTNLRNRRITGGGSVIWVTGSYRVNWVATGIINI